MTRQQRNPAAMGTAAQGGLGLVPEHTDQLTVRNPLDSCPKASCVFPQERVWSCPILGSGRCPAQGPQPIRTESRGAEELKWGNREAWGEPLYGSGFGPSLSCLV